MLLHRLAVAECLRALGWPGAVGAALLVAALGYGAAAVLPARHALAALQERAAFAERRAAALRSGRESAPRTGAAQRREFYAALPAQDEVAGLVERIYAAAANERLSLLHGEYTVADVPSTGLVRYRIVLPLQGNYGQVRHFVSGATTAVPGLVVDDLSLKRQRVGETQLEARAQLSLFLVKQR